VIAVSIVRRSRISPDEDHVGILTQRAAKPSAKVGTSTPDFALIHDPALVFVVILDRILDRDDVVRVVALITSSIEASVVDLPEPGRPRHEDQAPRQVDQLRTRRKTDLLDVSKRAGMSRTAMPRCPFCDRH
jgi:hypothetical protein